MTIKKKILSIFINLAGHRVQTKFQRRLKGSKRDRFVVRSDNQEEDLVNVH